MKPLASDVFKLLNLVVQSTPHTAKIPTTFLAGAVLRKHKRKLLSLGLIFLTGEKSQWERMFPTPEGKFWHEWQLPLFEQQKDDAVWAKRLLYLNPKNDGKTHINVYSQGNTPLGRLLSNFAKCKIVMPEGVFYSVEALWYWLLVDALGVKDAIGRAALVKAYGARAKELGRALMEPFTMEQALATGVIDEGTFRGKIAFAITIKILDDPDLQALLKKNTLPFEHYYVYRGKVVEPSEHKWVLGVIKMLAHQLKIRPTVHNLYKEKGWETDRDAVYIGRAGKGRDGYYGNPYPKNDTIPGEASAKFREYAIKRGAKDREYKDRVRGLKGKKLMCFCGNEHCHGHVLSDLCVEWNND